MSYSGFLEPLPLWAVFVSTAGMVLLSIEAGYQVGQYRRRRGAGEKEAPIGAIVGANLGLLGFILAFTFGLAASRFNDKREIVVEDANAIGTTFLPGLLPENNGEMARKLLREYVDARLDVVKSQKVREVLEKSETLQHQLWHQAEGIGRAQPNSVVAGLYLQALNGMIDVHGKRMLVSLQNRLPVILWVTLYFVTIVTMAGVGYQEGHAGSKRSLAVLILVLTFSAILTLIADLDSPQEGFLTVSQRAMTDLRKSMGDAPTAP